MPDIRVWETMDPDPTECPLCHESGDKWIKQTQADIEGFSVLATTTYHNPCGYRYTELKVDGKVVATRSA